MGQKRVIDNVSFTDQSTARRTTSSLWDEENDPFQVFEVEHEACLDLQVEITSGENISKGSSFKDFLDTPDPYVVLKVPGSSNSSQRTTALDNTVNPLWNQTFHFYLDPKNTHVLHLILMDANYTLDEHLGEDVLHVSSLPFDQTCEHIFKFTGKSIVKTKIRIHKNKSPDLRFSLSLCEKEKEYLRKRREKVLESFQKLLGDRAPTKKDEVPVVAILGSGGGFRAMTCFSGCVKALSQNGVLDCATYISGLSGSSWLISTLYAHDNFPNISFDDVYHELEDSVTQDWKKFLRWAPSYVLDIISKYRKGQPVSFTDFFGHLLGDVLLKGKKEKTLSHQQEIVSKGTVPFPLYTCLHAKAAISCRAFSEWVEFSPFEIGIAKYGTFMKTEHFGNKFICGKRIKSFPEFPLHFLQGVWGSAFTILIKRLVLEGGSNKDLVQILRDINDEREFVEKVEKHILEENAAMPVEIETDSDDEKDIIGADDEKYIETNSEKDIAEVKKNNDLIGTNDRLSILSHKYENTKSSVLSTIKDDEDESLVSFNSSSSECYSPAESHNNTRIITKQKFSEKNGNFSKSIVSNGCVNGNHKRNFSFDFIKKFTKDEEPKRIINSQDESGIISQKITNQTTRTKRLQRQGAIKSQTSTSSISRQQSTRWSAKRESLHNDREDKSTFIQSMMKNSNLLNSRVGRAGEILNPFRGLSLRESFPVSPFSSTYEEEECLSALEIGPGCRYDSLDNRAKKLFIVDSGLAFNSPYPLLLRPQRAVDIYISFDFSQRPRDSFPPFKELLLAEKWAIQNKVAFPPIETQAKIYSKYKEVQEVYVFKDPTDISCPVILHFPIVNNKFQLYKSPGHVRETLKEFEFGNFNLFDDSSQPYSSTNFVYSALQYERLVNMSEFNTLYCSETIKDELANVVENRRKLNNQSLQDAAIKVQKVMKASQIFKSRLQRLNLKINHYEGIKILNSIKRRSIYGKNRLNSECSTASEEEFQDVKEFVS